MKAFFTPSRWTVLAIVLIAAMVSNNINWGKDHWKSIIRSDAKGYYAYLPAVFIYHDLNYGFFNFIEKEKYYDELNASDYRSTWFKPDGENRYSEIKINKYYAGTALAQLPFFLSAHLLTSVTGCDADGYSKTYQIFINLAAIFYLLFGLLYLNRLLKLYGTGEWTRSLVLAAAVFGTNLFYYVIGEPGMSHVYSFAFITMFMYYAKKYAVSFRSVYLPLMAFALGMTVLIRPVNGLVLFLIPFLAGDAATLKTGFFQMKKYLKTLVTSLLIFAAIVSVQLILYKLSTGSYWVYSYGEEGFDFLHPAFSDILFSYKKGLFLYTPIFLISFTGCYFLWRRSKFQVVTFLMFFVLITYVFSSWWMWYYGGSFSSRVYVEYISLFMILLAVTLSGMKPGKLKTLFVSVVVLLILVCQVQTYQYRYYKIHWSDMTKEKYWDEFLRIDRIVQSETRSASGERTE